MGQYDECLSIEEAIEDNTNVLKGQYCLTQISLERDTGTNNLFDELDAKRQLKKDSKLKGSDARLLPTQQKQLELNVLCLNGFGDQPIFYFSFIRTFRLNIGICVPDSCSPMTMTQILNYAFNVSNISAVGLVSKDLCQTSTKAKDFNALDIVTM